MALGLISWCTSSSLFWKAFLVSGCGMTKRFHELYDYTDTRVNRLPGVDYYLLDNIYLSFLILLLEYAEHWIL